MGFYHRLEQEVGIAIGSNGLDSAGISYGLRLVPDVDVELEFKLLKIVIIIEKSSIFLLSDKCLNCLMDGRPVWVVLIYARILFNCFPLRRCQKVAQEAGFPC